MSANNLDPNLKAQLLAWQRTEISEHHVYKRLARSIKDPQNRQVIERIAQDELKHSNAFKAYTRQEVEPNRLQIFFYYLIARLLGLTFGIKLMERGEEQAQANYAQMLEVLPEIEWILHEEEGHEQRLLAMLDEEGLKYAGSVVLGLNDALVELTGALAGLSLAFQNTNLVALTGLITGISASLSMAASEYLSARAEGGETKPLKSALYTGLAYVFTVAVLILPYLLLDNYMLCLAWTLANAILVIAAFNFYLAIAKDLSFWARFFEMAAISLGVAAFSFIVGYLIRQLFDIEI